MQIFHFPFKAMACSCEIVLAAPSRENAQSVVMQAHDEVLRIESKFSRYRSDSVLSQINSAAGLEAVPCDEETWALLQFADTLHRHSDGLFDITAGVLRRAWDFKIARLPNEDLLRSLCRLTGWSKVEMADRQIRLPETGMEIDFGGFGKEYAADRAGAILAERGVQSGYVNLGGDLHVLGPKPDGQAWIIGIEHPRRRGEIMASIPVLRGGLATSGDYQRYFDLDGKRYCHVLDPLDGRPVSHWRTVSVIAPLTVVAGNCATITMLKQSAGLEFLERTGFDYLAMDRDGSIHRKGRAAPMHA